MYVLGTRSSPHRLVPGGVYVVSEPNKRGVSRWVAVASKKPKAPRKAAARPTKAVRKPTGPVRKATNKVALYSEYGYGS